MDMKHPVILKYNRVEAFAWALSLWGYPWKPDSIWDCKYADGQSIFYFDTAENRIWFTLRWA